MDEDDQIVFKIVVIGSVSTGKTNIATKYVRNQFNEAKKATIGVQFLSKTMSVHGQNIKITLWDTAGQQKYKSLSKVYYKGASGILIVYGIDDPQSYLDIESWMKLASQNVNINEVVLMIVGNKKDKQDERKVPTDRPINQFQKKFDIECWQTSAKTGQNINQVFTQLIERIYQINIGAKSQMKYDDESIVDSVMNTIAGPKDVYIPVDNTNNRVSNRICQQKIKSVVLEEEEPALAMPKKKQSNNEHVTKEKEKEKEKVKDKDKDIPKKNIKHKTNASVKLTEKKSVNQKNKGCC